MSTKETATQIVCRYHLQEDRIVRVIPNSERAREIIAEENHQVQCWNKHAARLNKIFGNGALPYKKNRFV